MAPDSLAARLPAVPRPIPSSSPGSIPTSCATSTKRLPVGRPVIETQHTQGQVNGPQTVEILGNDHRAADSYKLDWPLATLRNPNGSPLLSAAACIRGWCDVMRVVIDRTIAWIPPFLEHLDEALDASWGSWWWERLGQREDR